LNFDISSLIIYNCFWIWDYNIINHDDDVNIESFVDVENIINEIQTTQKTNFDYMISKLGNKPP